MPSPSNIDAIITRFLDGEATATEADMLFAWLRESSENRKYFDEMNVAYQASITLDRFSQPKIDKGWKQLQQRIGTDNQRVLTPRPSRNYLVAASVTLVLISLGYFAYTFFQPRATTAQRMLISSSKVGSTLIILPDSSYVWLNANSTLEYPSEFGQGARRVTLKGEAFFDVRKSKGKPFIVLTDDMDVTVKGTRFNIEALVDGENTRTTLEEGAVDLFVRQNKKLYAMEPGDQITIDAATNVTRKRVNPSYFSAWKESELVFDNATLEEIISKLENRFRATITIEQHLAKRERFTLTIGQETLDEVLALIQLSSSIKYRKENGRIIMFD